jgi:hypothetical protein
MAKGLAPRKVIEMMKEATGASDDDVCLMLQMCDGDPNKATEALLSSACPMAIQLLLLLRRTPWRRVLTVLAFLLQIPLRRWKARRTKGPRWATQPTIINLVFAGWAQLPAAGARD